VVQSQDAENDVLLMGDFNLGPDDSGFQSLKAIPNMVYVNGEVPTSIKDKLYDNIWFQSDHVREYKDISGIDRFDETDFGNDDEQAKSDQKGPTTYEPQDSLSNPHFICLLVVLTLLQLFHDKHPAFHGEYFHLSLSGDGSTILGASWNIHPLPPDNQSNLSRLSLRYGDRNSAD